MSPTRQTSNTYITLEELALLNGADKNVHKYMPFYASLFEPIRFNSLLILELGFAKGRGARCLLEYFPKANVHSGDISLSESQMYATHMPEDHLRRLHLHEFDQGSIDSHRLLLESVKGKHDAPSFDIVIDDCSHEPAHQILSFTRLWCTVTPGGFYVIEDMHPFYRNGKHTTIEFFKNHLDELNRVGNYKAAPTLDWQWVNFSPNRITIRKNHAVH